MPTDPTHNSDPPTFSDPLNNGDRYIFTDIFPPEISLSHVHKRHPWRDGVIVFLPHFCVFKAHGTCRPPTLGS